MGLLVSHGRLAAGDARPLRLDALAAVALPGINAVCTCRRQPCSGA